MGITTKKYLSNPSAKHECSLSGARTFGEVQQIPSSLLSALLDALEQDPDCPEHQSGGSASTRLERDAPCWECCSRAPLPRQGLWVAPGASPAQLQAPTTPRLFQEPRGGFHTHFPLFFRKKVLPIIFLSLLGRSGDAFPGMSAYGRCRLFMETGAAGGGQHTLPRNSWIRSSLSGKSRHLGGIRTTPPTVTAPALLPPNEPGTPPWNSPPASFQDQTISPQTFVSKLPNQEMTGESFTKQR